MSKNRFLVEWSREAYLDLEEIINYIITDSPVNASNILNEIQKKAENLYHFPEKGRIVPELKYHNITKYREVFHSVWRIIYKIEKNIVYVMLIIDGRRSIEDVLLQRVLRDK